MSAPFGWSELVKHVEVNSGLEKRRGDVDDNNIGPCSRFIRENVFSPYYNHIDFEVWQVIAFDYNKC
jgi:hypothetical protein